MCIDFEDIWNLEVEYSPVSELGEDRQIIKLSEEIGEMCADYLKGDHKHMKEELADVLNVMFGLATHIFSSPEELSTAMMNAIEKMSEKYPV